MTMTSSLPRTAVVFLMLSLGGACGSVSVKTSDDAGIAGSAGTGGSASTAGSASTTGSASTAGSVETAGTTGSVGTSAAGSAGTAGVAGNHGTGGTTGTAGSAGSTAIDGGIDGGNDSGIVTTSGHPVNLGKAGDYVILAKSGISTVPASVITGNLGVSPISATAVTGFSLIADSTNLFSRSPQVTGKVYAADYASPTPSNLTTAVGDMQLAFTEAAGRSPGVTELGA